MAQWLREMNPGDWYQSSVTSSEGEALDGATFEIVGVDLASEIVLIQHFDGALEELEFDSWIALQASPCAPPEDFSGALDLDHDDLPVDAIASFDDDAYRRLYVDSR